MRSSAPLQSLNSTRPEPGRLFELDPKPSKLKAIATRIAPGRLAMPAFPLPIRTSRYRKSLTEA